MPEIHLMWLCHVGCYFIFLTVYVVLDLICEYFAEELYVETHEQNTSVTFLLFTGFSRFLRDASFMKMHFLFVPVRINKV